MSQVIARSNAQRRIERPESVPGTKQLSLILLVLALICFGQFISPAAPAVASIQLKECVWPPCGCGSDAKVYDKAGFCDVCGMPLIVKGSAAAIPAPSQQP